MWRRHCSWCSRTIFLATLESRHRHNAERNGVAARTVFLQSDVFDAVGGTFDLIVFDPPSRWFTPRDLLKVSIADQNSRTLTMFVTEASDYLNVGGCILLFFGTSGDIGYLYSLLDGAQMASEVIASRDLNRDEVIVSYVLRVSACPIVAARRVRGFHPLL